MWTKLLIALSPFLATCGDDNETRPENINKLRALGVKATPSATDVSVQTDTPIDFQIHLVMPLDRDPKNIEVKPFRDAIVTPFELDLVVDAAPYDEKSYAALRHVIIKAKAVLKPTTKAFFRNAETVKRYSYALSVRDTQKNDEEKIKGAILVYLDKKTFTLPNVSIISPLDKGTLLSGSGLEGKLSPEPTERAKMSWFVSEGKVENRRAIKTKVEDIPTGKKTAILTFRGLESGAFSYSISDFEVK